ncbi:unnamed protein product [Meloidogyne enterolobii]|uniref:Uncharacterized protein n=2 Tax=Meloidogyne enterolobii TaxID=390850 RepID=A0ACB0YRM6_MELEN|nr:unnamed protein product [Meloidogyne enterolobii]
MIPNNKYLKEGIITRILRIGVKFAQLITSLFLTISIYYIGPYWIFVAASLAIPLYGLFLVFRSPERILHTHPLPFVRNKALERSRRWLRVDLSICITMAILCFLLSIILFIGYLVEHTINIFILSGASSSLLLAVLYGLNILLNVRSLQIGKVNFVAEKPSTTAILPPISSNNNIIFEGTSREEENWREIPIKVIFKNNLKYFFVKKIKTFPVSGEQIIEEEDCLRVEQRQRTPSGENVAMIFGRNKSYRQKEKSENGEQSNNYGRASTTTSPIYNEDIEGEGYSRPFKGLKRENNFLEGKFSKNYLNEENENKIKQLSPIRRRRRYQTSTSSKNFEGREESPTASITIERASSSPPYQHKHYLEENERIKLSSPNESATTPTSPYWKHQVTEL